MQKNKFKSLLNITKKRGFTLVEFGAVLVVVSVVVVAVVNGAKLIDTAQVVAIQNIITAQNTRIPPAIINNRRNLVLWLDAAADKSFEAADLAVTNSPISVWHSTNPFTLKTIDFTQSTPAKRPLFTKNSINALPTVKFVGTSGTYLQTSISKITPNKLEVFIVAKRISVLSGNPSVAIFHRNNGTDDFGTTESFVLTHEDHAGAGTMQVYRAAQKSTVAVAPENNTAYIYSVRFDGTNNTVYLNNVARPSVASTGNFGIEQITVGARFYGGGIQVPWNGYLGELIFFNKSLTDAERVEITKYLSDKWAIPVS